MRIMDACGEELQKDILSVLPELISEAEHEVQSAAEVAFTLLHTARLLVWLSLLLMPARTLWQKCGTYVRATDRCCCPCSRLPQCSA